MPKSHSDKWPLVGKHSLLLDAQDRARRVAGFDLPVNIEGETGRGKELLARYIHEVSARAKGPFVIVDCGLLSTEMARSELFGHVRGAFTGASETRIGLVEAASGGTLFLDEVGELSPELQLHLLRLVQEQEFRRVGETQSRRANIRLITATHRNLPEMVKMGAFREDLFYRLNVVPLHLPPLRKRSSDLPLLIEHFCQLAKGIPRVFTQEAIVALSGYSWPGNVRELQHVVAKLLVMGEGDFIGVGDLPCEICGNEFEADVFEQPFKKARQEAIRKFIREYLHRALMRTQGNVSLAAEQCGIGRQYFQMRMAESGLRSRTYKRKRTDQVVAR